MVSPASHYFSGHGCSGHDPGGSHLEPLLSARSGGMIVGLPPTGRQVCGALGGSRDRHDTTTAGDRDGWLLPYDGNEISHGATLATAPSTAAAAGTTTAPSTAAAVAKKVFRGWATNRGRVMTILVDDVSDHDVTDFEERCGEELTEPALDGRCGAELAESAFGDYFLTYTAVAGLPSPFLVWLCGKPSAVRNYKSPSTFITVEGHRIAVL